jgi:hypothetical protein
MGWWAVPACLGGLALMGVAGLVVWWAPRRLDGPAWPPGGPPPALPPGEVYTITDARR